MAEQLIEAAADSVAHNSSLVDLLGNNHRQTKALAPLIAQMAQNKIAARLNGLAAPIKRSETVVAVKSVIAGYHNHSRCLPSDAEAAALFEAAALNNGPPYAGAHALQKAVPAQPAFLFGLVSSFGHLAKTSHSLDLIKAATQAIIITASLGSRQTAMSPAVAGSAIHRPLQLYPQATICS